MPNWKNGRNLDGSRASDEDIDAAAGAISQLPDLKPQLERQTMLRTGRASANNRLAFTPGKVRAGTDLGVELAGWNSDQITGLKAIVDLGEVCGINGFVTSILSQDASHWAFGSRLKVCLIEKFVDGYYFIIKIGDKVRRIIVDMYKRPVKWIAKVM
jgi:hypothetical protein